MAELEKILKKWFGALDSAVPSIYVVGGAVRDHLLNRPLNDVDLVCRQAKAVCRQLAATCNATLVPFENKPGAECYRVVDRTQKEAFIDVSPLRGNDITADLNARDFTINAMAFPVKENGRVGRLIDPNAGAADLAKGVIRSLSEKSMIRDPLRMLRAFRFAAQFDFRIADRTLVFIRRQQGLIITVAAERIRTELLKLLSINRSAPHIRAMDDTGLLGCIFPEITPMKGCDQGGHHHLDVWDHSLLVLEKLENILNDTDCIFLPNGPDLRHVLGKKNRLPILKLAALLHDVGKPQCLDNLAEKDRTTFYGHDTAGGEAVREICRRLRLSNKEVELAARTVGNHMNVLNLSRPGVKPKTIAKWFRESGEALLMTVLLEMADVQSTLGTQSDPQFRIDHWAWSRRTVADYFARLQPVLVSKNLISGEDLKQKGIPPGPAMGNLLEKIRSAQDAGQIATREAALELVDELTQK